MLHLHFSVQKMIYSRLLGSQFHCKVRKIGNSGIRNYTVCQIWMKREKTQVGVWNSWNQAAATAAAAMVALLIVLLNFWKADHRWRKYKRGFSHLLRCSVWKRANRPESLFWSCCGEYAEKKKKKWKLEKKEEQIWTKCSFPGEVFWKPVSFAWRQSFRTITSPHNYELFLMLLILTSTVFH